jgi:hypothetical protein
MRKATHKRAVDGYIGLTYLTCFLSNHNAHRLEGNIGDKRSFTFIGSGVLIIHFWARYSVQKITNTKNNTFGIRNGVLGRCKFEALFDLILIHVNHRVSL